MKIRKLQQLYEFALPYSYKRDSMKNRFKRTVLSIQFLIVFSVDMYAGNNNTPAHHNSLRHAASFSRDLADRMSTLMFAAGTIDPLTLNENRELRNSTLKRQDNLETWFQSKRRAVRFEDLGTKEEKKNYRDFRSTMANYQFLRCSYQKRIEYIRLVNSYFSAFANNFMAGLTRFLGNTECGAVINTIDDRLKIPVTPHLRYFNRHQFTSMGAVYLPENSGIYLNLNMMIQSPSEFMDSFEHELWHHLLPPRDDSGAFRTLHFEGFTEVIAEAWREDMDLLCVGLSAQKKKSRAVQYPVQTAYASIYYGMDKKLTMQYLTGDLSITEFIAQFAEPKNDSFSKKWGSLGHPDNSMADQRTLRMRLATTFLDRKNITSATRRKVEKTLSDWGWKEDDGGPLNLSRFAVGDRLNDDALMTSFRQEKRFFYDFIQALTVHQLQILREEFPGSKIIRQLDLPEHLLDNFSTVFSYIRNPYHQFANR